ncbi:MAG: xanthine dehydrogenase family protein molybdopterin-binding subunit [Desulfovermiculus sp.]|nr:xanthine dehydrogenase family protein molybdopterin-binding subunit [Desulfovermiculus sp.]
MQSRDQRIIAGKGRFIDDLAFPNLAHLAFVGSSQAHARITGIDCAKALEMPGVLTVITGREVKEHTNPLPVQANFQNPGWTWKLAEVYALAVDKVYWYGEPVAAVVAESEYAAHRAAELIEVSYDHLPNVHDARQALQPDAPLLYEKWGDNKQVHLVFDFGDVDQAFAQGDEIMDVTYSEGRVTGLPIEPRGFVADYDPNTECLDVWGTFQTPYLQRHNMAETLGMPEVKITAHSTDIGGAFGLKIHTYKENVVALASKLLGRPVKYMECMREWVVTGPHQRDVSWTGQVAFTKDGRLLGMKATIVQDLGVESTQKGIAALSLFPACSAVANMYTWSGMHIEGIGAVSNKSFYCAYRGYGKDKGIKFTEHVVNQVANKLNMTPEEIRFKNFIPPEAFPYAQINNYTMDSGDYPATLQKVLDLADIQSWRKEQKTKREENRHIGLGVVTSIEPAGVAVPNCQMGGITQARVQMTADGTVEVHSDRTEIGQGAERSHAKIVSSILGCAEKDIYVKPVSSDWIGQGPLSSRGAVYPASAVAKAAKLLRGKVVKCAAHFLKCQPEDVLLDKGIIAVRSQPDNRLTFAELARKAFYFPGPRGLPKDMLLEHDHLLDVTTTWYSPTTPKTGTSYTSFCASADVAVVEVDIETGETRILKYAHVHDAGTIIDKAVVDGQIHGGIVQGIGEALSEEITYGPDSRIRNASLSEYVMPTAVDAPDIVIEHLETPSPYTETGSKGMGEAPIIGSKAVILAAIEDALRPWGIEVHTSPATPERVRTWVRQAVAGSR